MRSIISAVLIAALTIAGFALSPLAHDEDSATRQSTGGAQTLEDILARQRGEVVDDSFRRDALGDPGTAASIRDQLGTLGGVSNAELFRSLRYSEAEIVVSAKGPATAVIIQDTGMWWLEARRSELTEYGGYLLVGMLVIIALFYLIRGRIRVDGGMSGVKIVRFKAIERFAHWLLAGSFILLAISGLVTLFGRIAIIPLIGKEAFAPIASACKWIHNNVAWAFMLALVMVLLLWIRHNIPNRYDVIWMLKGGGLFSKGVHPPARKFNAGQKIIFWAVIILGFSISASGLSLLYPFEMPMFAATFEKMNDWGISQLLGLGELPTQLLPHEEMQFAHLWHGIVAFVFIAIVIAHIYLGSLGMEGAYDAMGTGEVYRQWAREHHGIWVKEMDDETKAESTTKSVPAE